MLTMFVSCFEDLKLFLGLIHIPYSQRAVQGKRLLEITGEYYPIISESKRLLEIIPENNLSELYRTEITREYYPTLLVSCAQQEITGDYWRLLENTILYS